MIVTCPRCSAKYRVRNESVPEEGARLRCPSCDALFLAKLPPNAAHTNDDSASPYAQLEPTGPGSRPASEQSGSQPRTAHAAAPSTPPAPPAPPPTHPERQPSSSQSQAAPAPPAARPALLNGLALAAVSWGMLALGSIAATLALLLSLWSTEALNLDALLMGRLEESLGVRPPYSVVGRGRPSADALRAEADAALTQGDLATALVLWQRVKERAPSDPRTKVQIVKLKTELGDVEGSP